MQGYFAPVDVGGIQLFTQGGTAAGWYQLPVPGAVCTLLPGITIPDSATGVIFQAHADITYSLSPAQAALNPTTGLTLWAGGTAVFSGQDAIRQLCIKLPASGASFSFQWCHGDIGPIPLIR